MTEIENVLIVGSGGNAIAVAARLAEAGITDYRVITAHGDYGGAWWVNRYPGCGVDTPALDYQLECALGTPWTREFPMQPEILAYFQKVARDLGMYERTEFEVEMTSCRWDEARAAWEVETTRGPRRARHLILATGFLDDAVSNVIPGYDSFRGRYFHSQHWPSGYTGEGDRIAVIGSGSSGLQIVPAMQRAGAEVVVFQRTPNWILPQNQKVFTEEERAFIATNIDHIRKKRRENEEWRRAGYRADLELDPDADREAMFAEIEAQALAFLEQEVPDPELRKLLTPDYNFGCKRPGMSDDWFRALQQPNVELVPEAASAITEDGVVSRSGRAFEVDTIVMATGFRWGTSILDRVQRRDGLSVAEAQGGHPRAYKGIQVSMCPNLFLVGGGPNGRAKSLGGLRTGEIASHYIVTAIAHMEHAGVAALEVLEEAETEWKQRADTINARGAYSSGQCTNYLTDDFGNNMADWPGDDLDQIAQHTVFVAEHYREPSSAPVSKTRGEEETPQLSAAMR
ncbi:flavin-containing monooxygenase [Salipiger abyssi]|uniref:Putative flavoprotein involved in K+ transport n=1 Tax=Salipiger abyssi TaxID=1250539 RepID=A0A1P8UN16_9RHOB|nr:NAD(P)/FAD-dependent oxidoreductase [Salipiger abyssi]APZ50770.1 putative flavoprotein involved in K+ transport [Salipiger abyssi]